MSRKLKLGTRRSLLAWAQSSSVAREIERRNPGIQVELVGIETRGDVIQDVSLREVQGKEFFVAEIDEALKSRATDLSVHSMKDLSLDRPPELVLAAIPKRANPRDALLAGPRMLERLRSGQPVRIGSSSPRRIENIPAFLDRALPRPHGPIEMVEIRGNVNTRLSRVHEPESTGRALDGVVLALAGLIRLWADPSGRAELERLLRGCRWMILPLRECAAAPAQGALAIECRADDAEARAAIGKLHDDLTAAHVSRERELLRIWGGGCHQRFGATAIESRLLGELFFVKGAKPDGSPAESFEWMRPVSPGRVPSTDVWCGTEHRASGVEAALGTATEPLAGRSVLVAHSRAATRAWVETLAQARVWTSGTASWFRLADLGLWVEGSSEGLGVDALRTAIEEPVLGLADPDNWIVLSHDGAEAREFGRVIPTYRVPSGDTRPESIATLSRAKYLYWGGSAQFAEHVSRTRPDAVHACGPGKTAYKIREHGLHPVVFPNAEEWKKWLGI